MKYITLLFSIMLVSFALQAQTGPVLLGMAESYGANNAGTIFQYQAGDSSISTVFSFPANGYMEGPLGTNMIKAFDGKLYGLNTFDGGNGTLFEYDYAANIYTVLASFDSAVGQFPFSSLLQATNGKLYGLTSGGDSTGGGTIFSYTIGDAAVTKLVTLANQAQPQGALIQAANGKLYGLTDGAGANGSGSIFQYDINSGVYSTLFSFPGNSFPAGNLLEVGADTLYGLTNGGGTNLGGTLFRYVVGDSTDTILYNLPQNANPASDLTLASNGLLYGLTNADGADSAGTLFSYNIANATYSVLYNFGASYTDGHYPAGGVIQASDGKLYGTTNLGGTDSSGTLFSYNISTSTYKQLISFNTATGGNPGAGFLLEYLSGTSGVNDTKAANYRFDIYPNPSSGYFTLVQNYPGPDKARILNLLGQDVLNTDVTSSRTGIDISNLATGMYQVIITGNGQVLQVLKLIKD